MAMGVNKVPAVQRHSLCITSVACNLTYTT